MIDNFYAIYNPSGEIVLQTSGKYPHENDIPENCQVLKISPEFQGFIDDTKYYVDVLEGTLELRAESDIDIDKSIIQADGVDKVSFSSIPTGAEVFVNGQTVGLCDDGIFEFSSDVVGSHTITIKKVEFLDYQVIINAV